MSNNRVSLTIDLDSSQLRESAEASKLALRQLCAGAGSAGAAIDQAVGQAGAARSFTLLEAAVRGVGREIGTMALESAMGFDTASEKIGALSYLVQANEAIMAEASESLAAYKAEADRAFADGDTAALDSATAAMERQSAKIAELAAETQDYRNALDAVKGLSGMDPGADVPRLYSSEKDLAEVEKLRNEIAGTMAEMARVASSGGDTTSLSLSLADLTTRLNDNRTAAAQAAAALGEDLGARAASAQQELHALNVAVAEQQARAASLAAATADARKELEALAASGSASSEEAERAAARYNTLSSALADANDRVISLQTAQNTAQGTWNGVSEEINAHSSLLAGMLGGYDNMQKMLGQLPQPLQAAVSGITGMTGAAKMFIATPLGAVIGAVVLALQALRTWFDSTVEGQLAFAEMSGYVSGVLGQLKEIVITVGKAIYGAFSDPKQAVADLWEAIRTNFVNRVKSVGDMMEALGGMMKSAFTLDWDGVKAGAKDLLDGFLKLGTGIDGVTGKLSDWAGSIHSAASETATISKESRELEIEVSKWQVRNQELEKQKAEARGRMYNSSLPVADRKKAKSDFEAALNEQIETEKKFADRRIELQKRTMELTSNSIEDENRLRDLEAARAALDTRQAQELASLQRRSGAMASSEASAAQKLERERQQREQALVQLGEAEAAIVLRNEQARLDLMEDGHGKRMEQLRHDYEEEKNEIEKLRNSLVQLNKKAGKETGEDGLTDSQRSWLVTASKNTDASYSKGVRDELADALSSVRTYLQERQEIEKKYKDMREVLYETDPAGNKVMRKGVDPGNLDELNRQEAEAFDAVDAQFAQREETYRAWCDQITGLTLKQLTAMLARVEEELARMEEDGDVDDSTLARFRAMRTTLGKAVKSGTAADSLSPGQRSLKEWKELYEVLGDVRDEFESIGETVGGVVGDIMSECGKFATSTLQIIDGIKTLATTSQQTISATGEIAAESMSAMEKASVILTVISAAMSIGQQIANLFNSDGKKQEEIEALQDRIDQLEWELGNASTLRLIERRGSALETVRRTLAATRQELSMGKTGWELFLASMTRASHDAALMADTAERLAKAYAETAYTADKALGSAKYGEAEARLKKIAQQQILISEQIDAERSKKDTDEGTITDWERQVEELGQEALDIINEMVEDIMGDSADGIARTLGDAFIDAFAAGEDAARAWGDAVNGIVADILRRMLVQQLLEQPLGEIFDKYKARWFPGGEFAGIDAVVGSLGSLAADLNGPMEAFREVMESLPPELRDMLKAGSSASQTPSYGGFETMSEDTGTELNGRFAAMQICAENTLAHISAIAADVAAVREQHEQWRQWHDSLTDTLLVICDHLASISRNTHELYEMNARLEKIERYTSRL